MRFAAILLLASLLAAPATADHVEDCELGDAPCHVEAADDTAEHLTEGIACENPGDGIAIFGVRDC